MSLYKWDFVVSPKKVEHLACRDYSRGKLVTSCMYPVTDKWTVDNSVIPIKQCKNCEEWRKMLIAHFEKRNYWASKEREVIPA